MHVSTYCLYSASVRQGTDIKLVQAHLLGSLQDFFTFFFLQCNIWKSYKSLYYLICLKLTFISLKHAIAYLDGSTSPIQGLSAFVNGWTDSKLNIVWGDRKSVV